MLPNNLRGALVSLAIGCLLFVPTTVMAQLAVQDAPTEAATAQTAGELQQDITVNTETAQSVITPGDPGLYQGVNGYLDGLNQNFSAADNSAGVFNSLFPGWVPLPADAIPLDSAVATTALATYSAALTNAQTQAQDFDSENTYLGSIEAANVGATGLLQAVQINTEAQLAVAQQIQMLRELEISHITLEATKAGEELNERAQAGATTAQAANQGVSPQ